MTDLRAFLDKSELFSNLEPSSLDLIDGSLSRVVFDPGRAICVEGEPGDCMFMVESGSVSVLSEMGWGQRELERMGPGAVFGEMALISDEARSATVKAIERTECLSLKKADFDRLLVEDHSLAVRAARFMTRRMSGLVHRTSNELVAAYRATLFALAELTESRDPETGAHLERTRNYCALLAERLARLPRYQAAVTPAFIDSIYHVAPLHDIGKVAVPDAILLKPGRLDPAEFEVMKRHAASGAAAFDEVLRQSDQSIFHMAREVCLHHHERWDGTGYPSGLSGEAIPLEARIMSLADVFDALVSKRVYKPAMSRDEAAAEIRKNAGTQFDPALASVMLEDVALFGEIGDRFRDD